MEEKTEYKLCPYCKSIYIPTENYCCKHCYEKSFIIRRDVYAQIQSKNKKSNNNTCSSICNIKCSFRNYLCCLIKNI